MVPARGFSSRTIWLVIDRICCTSIILTHMSYNNIIVQSSFVCYYVCQKNRDRRVFSVVCDHLDAANAEFGRQPEPDILRYC